jgi:3-oxoacyl-(acyl-carrier-protein) synthase
MIDLARAEVVVTGTGAVCGRCDATPFVKTRKLRKFMGTQDELAVVAAGCALQSARLASPLGERCGVYLAVGYIPFERSDIDQLLDASLEDGEFSMHRFAADAFGAINPLLTFRVLPNMPAFHVSLNFDIQGPYVVSYPGAGQFYGVLEEAIAALAGGAIDVALVGGVADQQNVLVEHHFSRIPWPVESSRLANAAAVLVIERAHDALSRGARARARLLNYRLDYVPVDPFVMTAPFERVAGDGMTHPDACEFGPASLGVVLARATRGRIDHEVRTRDGFIAASTWEVA